MADTITLTIDEVLASLSHILAGKDGPAPKPVASDKPCPSGGSNLQPIEHTTGDYVMTYNRIGLIVEWAYHQAAECAPHMADWYRDRGLQLQSALDLSEHWRLTGERAGTPRALATGNANAEATLARQAGLVIELENLRDALARVSA